MKKYYIDTNFILRFLLKDVPQQSEEALKYFQEAENKRITIFISFLVFIEVDFALKKFYKIPKKEAIKKMKVLANIDYLDIEKKELLNQSLTLYNKNNIDFVDAIFYSEAKLLDYELLTFDKKLKKLIA